MRYIYILTSFPQMSGTTELSMEGVKGVGSELERVHIAEKNKAMAAIPIPVLQFDVR